MDDHASGDDHQRMLAWLDSSLEWARAEDRTGLVKLLRPVQTDVFFEMDLSETSPSSRTTVDEATFSANRGA